jgi:hypothetical protein
MDDVQAVLRKKVESHMGELYKVVRGEVLMSGVDTLSRQTKVMIMGFNPGGQGLNTIPDHLVEYFDSPSVKRVRIAKENYSAYLHQCWDEDYWVKAETCEGCLKSFGQTGKIRQHRHQQTVEQVADALGVDLTKALAINAIFQQSVDIPLLRAELSESLFKHFLRVYWPIHNWLIDEVLDTRLIICLGNGNDESSFSFVRRALKIKASAVMCNGDDYRDGKYFETEKFKVIGIPHPSRFGLSDKLNDFLKLQTVL